MGRVVRLPLAPARARPVGAAELARRLDEGLDLWSGRQLTGSDAADWAALYRQWSRPVNSRTRPVDAPHHFLLAAGLLPQGWLMMDRRRPQPGRLYPAAYRTLAAGEDAGAAVALVRGVLDVSGTGYLGTPPGVKVTAAGVRPVRRGPRWSLVAFERE